MPPQSLQTGGLCAAAVVAAITAAYGLGSPKLASIVAAYGLQAPKLSETTRSQLWARIKQILALLAVAQNYQLLLAAPRSLDSAIQVITTLSKKYNLIKNYVPTLFTVSVLIQGSDILNGHVRSWVREKELPNHRYTNFWATAGLVESLRRRTCHMTGRALPVNTASEEIKLNAMYGNIRFWQGWRPFWIIRSSSRTHGMNDMTIRTLGFSPEPIMKFLEMCSELAEQNIPKQQGSVNTVTTVFHPQRLSGSTGGGGGGGGVPPALENDPFFNQQPNPTHSWSMYPSPSAWNMGERKPMRRLDTVYIDEQVKGDLLRRIGTYLNPLRFELYAACGVPRRLGFLFHGPPGTGKTSLSLALAGQFRLPLYILDVPDLQSDAELKTLFKGLPSNCFVLLEDVDCVGSSRTVPAQAAEEAAFASKMTSMNNTRFSSGGSRVGGVTLSGLLNVIDGPDSVNGRILLMSSNHPEQLDPALIRPGRVDQKLYLGHISSACAETMFFEIYAKFREAYRQDLARVKSIKKESKEKEEKKDEEEDDEMSSSSPTCPLLDMTDEELRRHAADFGSGIPSGTFTPAELQVYIFDHENSACAAVEELPEWVKEQVAAKQVV
ncbi:P-loop containing nucleoside triphosphate hydrolase protein [Apiospora arundinis]|uniref:P-loop containing nucleoside triphosphate hydrolase protein n=1 Tax=Apiospora arundinis TaxID=335852 RepID=A0ABR2HLH2_9PEZI